LPGWLNENYVEEIASEYATYSLMIPAWNSPELNNALEDLRLCLAFGPQQPFGASTYYEDRGKLGLPDDRLLYRMCQEL